MDAYWSPPHLFNFATEFGSTAEMSLYANAKVFQVVACKNQICIDIADRESYARQNLHAAGTYQTKTKEFRMHSSFGKVSTQASSFSHRKLHIRIRGKSYKKACFYEPGNKHEIPGIVLLLSSNSFFPIWQQLSWLVRRGRRPVTVR